MHPAMQLRVDCVAAFALRATRSTAELYSLEQTDTQTESVRYQVVCKKKHLYNVVERSTGKIKGYRYTWRAALMLALVFEGRADNTPGQS